MTRLPFHVSSDGWTEAPEAIARRGGSWRRKVRFPATAFLLEHPTEGLLLVDTGYSSRFFKETKRLPQALYRHVTPVRLTQEGGIAECLRRKGINAGDVRHIVITHFHADRIGGLRDFPQARIHASAAAWNNVRNLRGFAAVRQAFLPGLLPDDIGSRLNFANEGSVFLGDGSIRFLDLPGHAVGQMGVRFTGHSGRPVLLAADACWLSDAFRENVMPHGLTRLLHQWSDYRASLRRLHQLHRDEPDLLIMPSHCPETARLIQDV